MQPLINKRRSHVANDTQDMNGAIDSLGASGFSKGIRPTVSTTARPDFVFSYLAQQEHELWYCFELNPACSRLCTPKEG